MYLPLDIGNYWQLDHSAKNEIVGTKLIDNKSYYSVLYQDDTSYYRIENDKVIVIEYTENASVKFDLSADVNESWKYNSYTVKLLSTTDTISINNQKIINCYQFYYDIPGVVDEEHSIWLAPGIGIIQETCGECLHPVRKLDKARIGEENIDY
jgi:hypothetical protein